MKAFLYLLTQVAITLISFDLWGQARVASTQDTVVYHLFKTSNSSTLSFIGTEDTIHFDAIQSVKKSDGSRIVLRITDGGRVYRVVTYFSGLGYHITAVQDDSFFITYGDIPYGELIVNGIPKADQTLNLLDVNRLDCVVSINGVKGEPKLDLIEKSVDTENLKRTPINDMKIAGNNGDKVFCSAVKDFSNSLREADTYQLRFNEVNSNELNERLKISILFILWLYENVD